MCRTTVAFECDILERTWYKWFRNKLALQKHGALFQVYHLWDISQFTFSDPCVK